MRQSSATGQTSTPTSYNDSWKPSDLETVVIQTGARPLGGDAPAVGCISPPAGGVFGQWDRLIHGYQVTHLGPTGHGRMTTLR